jgi:hypothetical protein
VRARRRPAVGAAGRPRRSGPLGPGLLASGLLGTSIRELQASLADPDHALPPGSQADQEDGKKPEPRRGARHGAPRIAPVCSSFPIRTAAGRRRLRTRFSLRRRHPAGAERWPPLSGEAGPKRRNFLRRAPGSGAARLLLTLGARPLPANAKAAAGRCRSVLSTPGGQRRRARRTTSAMCGVPGGGSIRGWTACSSTLKSPPSSRPRSSAPT